MNDEPLNHLSCRIFCEADSRPKELAELLTARGGSSFRLSSGPVSSFIHNEIGELEIRRNEDRNDVLAQQFPDGFLHFHYVLELYPRSTPRREDEVNYVARLLQTLWSSGFPAVASCDYENELPHHGGYRDTSLPWPAGIVTA